MNILLKKPLISEKSMKLVSAGWYTFLVSKGARKQGIKKMVDEQFGVVVTSIKTANFKGKVKLQRNKRKQYTTADFKKAWVKLKEGQKIDVFIVQSPPEESSGKEVKEIKEKKSLLKGTKVKIEKSDTGQEKAVIKGKKVKDLKKEEEISR